MTITRESIDAKFISALEADKPCFIVNNLLTGTGFTGRTNKWYRAETGATPVGTKPTFVAANDGTLADLAALPISYTQDNRAALYSSPADGGDDNNYYWGLYETKWQTVPGASYSEYPQSFYADTIVIKSHAWGKGTSTTYPDDAFEVSVDLSDSTTFTGGDSWPYVFLVDSVYMDENSVLAPNPVRSGVSHTMAQIHGYYKYKIDGAAFFRLEFRALDPASNYWTSDLKVGEVFIGERIQMSRNPNQPYATELAYDGNITDFESSNGDIVRYVRSKGRRRFELDFTPTGDDSYEIDDIEQIRLLAKKTHQFTEPFMYIPKPYTEPNNAYFVYLEDASFQLEAVGPFERSVSLTLVEIPPFVDYEVGV